MHRRVALFLLEHDEARDWVFALAEGLGFEPVVARRPNVAAVFKAAPDLLVFDCQAAVPNQWVQLLQELRQAPLFESTPALVLSPSRQVPSALLELRHVVVLVKPFQLAEVFRRLRAVGLACGAGDEGADRVEVPVEPFVVDRRLAPSRRPKSDKFRILDSPRLLEGDLQRGSGVLGCAVLYLDIDHFKELNTQHLEREIDRRVLGPFQQLLSDVVVGNGHVYAEGGDEVIIFLPNVTERMAHLFAETVRDMVERAEFAVNDTVVKVTVSIGLAAAAPSAPEVPRLPDLANAAKRWAKERGRNQVAQWRPSETSPPARAAPPELRRES